MRQDCQNWTKTFAETIQPLLTLPSYRLFTLNSVIHSNAMVSGKASSRPVTSPSRRLTSRVPALGDVWVYWQCQGREDVSCVRDMSMGGLFIETPQPRAEGVLTRLHFLVQEGQIRADAVVKHAESGAGLGLKFVALTEQDRPKLAALLTRLRAMHHSREKS
jgi:hypothetical protein